MKIPAIVLKNNYISNANVSYFISKELGFF